MPFSGDAEWQELASIISERWKGLDSLINNAGVAASGDIDTFAMKDFQWTVDINLMGAVKGCHVCVPLLKESKGLLINVASMAGLLHMGGVLVLSGDKTLLVVYHRASGEEIPEPLLLGRAPWQTEPNTVSFSP